MFGRRKDIPRPPQKRYSRGMPLSVWERYLERGLHYMQNKNYDKALADLDAAIEENPRIGELYAARALILYHMERDKEAAEDAVLALQIDRHQWFSFYVRGLLAMRQKDYETAIEHFSQAQRYVPQRPEVLHSRAMAYWGYGHTDLALADLEAALAALDKDDKQHKTIKSLLNRFKKAAKS